MVCYDAWEENRLINSIGINKNCEYEVWLEPREGDNNSRGKYICPNCGGNLTGKPLMCFTCGYEKIEGDEK